MAAHCATFMEDMARQMARPLDNSTLELVNLWVLEEGRKSSSRDLCRGLYELNRICRQVGPFFETYDVLVTPGTATPPPPLGFLFADNPGNEVWERMRAFTPFTHIYNGTGQPAMSVPAMLSEDRVPLGVQLVARYGADGSSSASPPSSSRRNPGPGSDRRSTRDAGRFDAYSKA